MQISSTIRSTASKTPKTEVAAKQAEQLETPDSTPKDGVTFQSIANTGAYVSGGAMGGVGLGVISGQILGTLTGTPSLATVGGAVGALGGAATAISASRADDAGKVLKQSFTSWAGASVGAGAGMAGLGALGQLIADNGGAAMLGSQGQLIGATTGVLIGLAVPLAKNEDAFSKGIGDVAVAVAGGAAGLLAGGGLQVAAALEAPGLSFMLTALPAGLGLAGALTSLNFKHNFASLDNAEKDHNSTTLVTANKTVIGAVAGAGLGVLVGAIAQDAGASVAYATAGPAVAATLGGLMALGTKTRGAEQLTPALQAGIAGTAAGAGVIAGDMLGHGLTAITGDAIYQQIGAAAGGVSGLAAGLSEQGLADKYSSATLAGTVAGTTAGALLGVGLTALTGQSMWSGIVPIMGSVAGGLGGLAYAANSDDGKWGTDAAKVMAKKLDLN